MRVVHILGDRRCWLIISRPPNGARDRWRRILAPGEEIADEPRARILEMAGGCEDEQIEIAEALLPPEIEELVLDAAWSAGAVDLSRVAWGPGLDDVSLAGQWGMPYDISPGISIAGNLEIEAKFHPRIELEILALAKKKGLIIWLWKPTRGREDSPFFADWVRRFRLAADGSRSGARPKIRLRPFPAPSARAGDQVLYEFSSRRKNQK
jgi:hypothetical protein